MKNFGLDITVDTKNLNIEYGPEVSGPEVEIRTLDAIRASLRDPECEGPDKVYAIAMDVYQKEDRNILDKLNLLFGIVTYASGSLGDEPIRSQGHRHAISPSCNKSTGELYEIWDGIGIIYMLDEENKIAYAVEGKAGDKILVPPNWIHATVSGSSTMPLTFGAWCVKDYGFDYVDVRKNKGISHFPIFEQNQIKWLENENYENIKLVKKSPRKYTEFGISDEPIYDQFKADPEKFMFISKPSDNDFIGFTP